MDLTANDVRGVLNLIAYAWETGFVRGETARTTAQALLALEQKFAETLRPAKPAQEPKEEPKIL